MPRIPTINVRKDHHAAYFSRPSISDEGRDPTDIECGESTIRNTERRDFNPAQEGTNEVDMICPIEDAGQSNDMMYSVAENSDEGHSSTSHSIAAMYLTKLRECGLSQRAIDEVVLMNSVVVENLLQEIKHEVLSRLSSNEIAEDMPLAQEIGDLLDTYPRPTEGLETAYRQQAYLQRHFPYVVSISLSMGICAYRCVRVLLSFHRNL